MAKRPRSKPDRNQRAAGAAVGPARESWFGPAFLLLAGYALVDHVPQFDAVDVMGAQWLYLAVLNLVALGWLFRKGTLRVDGAFHSLFMVAFVALMLLALLSFAVAYNKVESLVTYSRLWITFSALIVAFTLLRDHPRTLVPILALLAISAVVRSGTVWAELLENMAKYDKLDDVIYYIRGNSGNKNILAATLAVKMPFVLLFALRSKGLWRGVSLIGFGLVLLAILIVNARTAYLSSAIIVLGGAMWPFLSREGLPLRNKIRSATAILGCAAIALLASVLLFRSLESRKQVKQYGAITERISSITVSNDASSGRLKIWCYALDFISQHPVLGGGYGNWKIHSIPYEKYDLNGFGCRKHAHNDFLEMAAETGIAGGLAYALIFLGALLLAWRGYNGALSGAPDALLAWCMALAWAAYGLDAALNFPTERANMQAVFALIAAAPLLWARRVGQAGPVATAWPFRILLLVSCLAAAWVSWQAYRSMAVQNTIAAEWFGKPDTSKTMRVNPDELAASFPAIPNISEVCMPISCMKAKYFAEAKRFPEALRLLDQAAAENPYLGYDLFMRGMIALQQGDRESALKFAREAVELRPVNLQINRFLATIGMELQDTLILIESFNAIRPHLSNKEGQDDHARRWSEHAQNMMALRAAPSSVNAIADSGLVKYPTDEGLLFIKHFNTALALFNAKRYVESIPEFEAALPNAEGLGQAGATARKLCLDDLGFACLNIGDYARAKYWLDASLAQQPNDAKVRYFRGICAEQLGDAAGSCADFMAAAQGNYPVEEVRLARCR